MGDQKRRGVVFISNHTLRYKQVSPSTHLQVLFTGGSAGGHVVSARCARAVVATSIAARVFQVGVALSIMLYCHQFIHGPGTLLFLVC